MKVTVEREISEDDPDEGPLGDRAAQQDLAASTSAKVATTYGLRDPSFEERRVLFECRVDKIATFGQP